jgi:hypothetical protein
MAVTAVVFVLLLALLDPTGAPAATPRPPCPCTPASLCASLNPQPPAGMSEQAAFLAGWEPRLGHDITSVLPWVSANITSVTVFGATSFTKTLCEAHRHGARAITLLPLSPGGTGADISSREYRQKWVNASIQHLRSYGGGGVSYLWFSRHSYYHIYIMVNPSVGSAGWDGGNLDVEGFDDSSKRDDLSSLVCELRAAMTQWLPGSQLSFDSSMDPARDSQFYDYVALSQCIVRAGALDVLYPHSPHKC